MMKFGIDRWDVGEAHRLLFVTITNLKGRAIEDETLYGKPMISQVRVTYEYILMKISSIQQANG